MTTITSATTTTPTVAGAPAFRAATIDDTAAIRALLTASGLPIDGVSELLAGDARQFVVATVPGDDTEIVAVAGLEVCGDHGLLRSLAVRADRQRHGLGHELVRRVVQQAESRGMRALYLLTTTAEHYFPRFGFEAVSRDAVPPEIANTLEFRSACPASAAAMARALPPR